MAFCLGHFLKVPGDTLMDRAATISLFMGLGLAGRLSNGFVPQIDKGRKGTKGRQGSWKKTCFFVPISVDTIVDESTNNWFQSVDVASSQFSSQWRFDSNDSYGVHFFWPTFCR